MKILKCLAIGMSMFTLGAAGVAHAATKSAVPKGWSKTTYTTAQKAAKATGAFLFNKGARKAGDRLGTPLVDIVPLQASDFAVKLTSTSKSGERFAVRAVGNLPTIKLAATVKKFGSVWRGKTSLSPSIWSDYNE